jgi:hypothetical protein
VIKLAVMGEVKTHFRPEFINRIDEIVVFHALDEKHIQSIAKIQLRYPGEAPGQAGDDADGRDAALAELAKAGFDPVFGARPLKRAIQEHIENPLLLALWGLRMVWARLTGQPGDAVCDAGGPAWRVQPHVPGRIIRPAGERTRPFRAREAPSDCGCDRRRGEGTAVIVIWR